MKKSFKAICTSLLALLVVTIPITSVSAMVAPQYRGDVNLDGASTIEDATEIQRYAANQVEFSKRQLFAGDVDGDGKVTVNDSKILCKTN